jgi:hypothetical protein
MTTVTNGMLSRGSIGVVRHERQADDADAAVAIENRFDDLAGASIQSQRRGDRSSAVHRLVSAATDTSHPSQPARRGPHPARPSFEFIDVIRH